MTSQRGARALDVGIHAARFRWSRLCCLSPDEEERGGVVNRGAPTSKAEQ
jgi:hypothetical protein